MVARTTLDTIVSLSWMGALACVLLARALFSWTAFRRAARYEREARRLSEATGAVPGGGPEHSVVAPPIPLSSRRPPKRPAARAEC